MVSEPDIDQTLDNTTFDGNQIEETIVSIRVVVIVDAQISVAMDEWCCCLQTVSTNMISSLFPSFVPPCTIVGAPRVVA